MIIVVQAQVGIDIKVFPDPNFQGNPVTLFIRKGYCGMLPPRIVNNVSSIVIGNNCIRIYKRNDCTGDSQTLDGRSINSPNKLVNNLNSINFNDQVRSVEMC